jgi:hypothetical protein
MNAIKRTSQSMNLLIDVPKQVVYNYAQHLDARSCAMFMTACSLARDTVGGLPKDKHNEMIGELVCKTVELLVRIHNVITTKASRDRLLANLLRKLIFVSASDVVNAQGTSAIAFDKCIWEHHRLFSYFRDLLDISWMQFNNLLEDAQFEFRGFDIITLNEEDRRILDTFKNHIEQIYFNKPFTIHSYFIKDTLSMEIDYDGKHICFDMHEESREGNHRYWSYLYDKVNDWLAGDRTPLHYLFHKSNFSICNEMVCWDPKTTERNKVSDTMGQVLPMLMPDTSMFLRGTKNITLEVWNDTMETNWVLTDVIHEMLNVNDYKIHLINISHEVEDIYNLYMFANRMTDAMSESESSEGEDNG